MEKQVQGKPDKQIKPEAKELISLLSFFTPKLKAVEITNEPEPKEEVWAFDALTDDELIQFHSLAGKMLESEV